MRSLIAAALAVSAAAIGTVRSARGVLGLTAQLDASRKPGEVCDISTQQRLLQAFAPALLACDIPVDTSVTINTTPLRFLQTAADADASAGTVAGKTACTESCKAALLAPIQLTPADFSCIASIRQGGGAPYLTYSVYEFVRLGDTVADWCAIDQSVQVRRRRGGGRGSGRACAACS
jgi:hypothetical protein